MFSFSILNIISIIKFASCQETMQEPGQLYVWGRGYPAIKELKKNVTAVGAGENHFIYIVNGKDVFGIGSNKFGQLGLPDNITYSEPQRIFEQESSHVKISPKSIHCGAEHTFFITGTNRLMGEKNEVYCMGLNIKGQLGLCHFQNISKPKIVISLLPHGKKNPKSLNPALQKSVKPPIIQILEKFDLQIKIEDESTENNLLLDEDEFIEDIKCGALFTIALSNKGRVFACGYQGVLIDSSEDFLDKAKFKPILLDYRIIQISAGLSGAGALSREGFAFVWGRYGKNVYNIPKRVKKIVVGSSSDLNEQDKYASIQIGDQFIALLNVKGEIFTFGENIENQLGCQSEEVAFKSSPEKVTSLPLMKGLYVGRNHCFSLSGENELYGWGSNRYNQISSAESIPMIVKPRNLSIKISEGTIILPSSYYTLAVSSAKVSLGEESIKKSRLKAEQMIQLSEYKKLLHDYQVLKSLNLALLEKSQPPKKESKEVQTLSKFEIDGVTKYRQFDSNLQIEWAELEIIDRLNEGGYGVIYKAKWRQIQVVVKKFKIDNGDVSLRDFLSECNAMEAVRHPHIVMFLGAVTKPKNYSIILEYCRAGSLWSYLQNHDFNIPWDERKRFAIEIAQAVLYLHECNPPILHRDLKSLNIFLDEHLRIKIGDFGWTKTLDEYMTNKIGTYQWMAPEVIGNKPYTEKADVFSFSIILWEIASRDPPYRNITGAKVSEAVLYNQLRPQIPKKTPEPFSKLMKKCWETNPEKRPSFRQIIKELQIMKLG